MKKVWDNHERLLQTYPFQLIMINFV